MKPLAGLEFDELLPFGEITPTVAVLSLSLSVCDPPSADFSSASGILVSVTEREVLLFRERHTFDLCSNSNLMLF